MKNVIQGFVERAVATGVATPDEIEGCTDEEIDGIEARFNLWLPRAYREFLSVVGRRAGTFLVGSDIYYPRVLELRRWAEDLLSEQGHPFGLPEDAFVFLMHQGYQFHYFLTGTNDGDPVVYHYRETNSLPVPLDERFFEFITRCLEDTISVRRRVSRPARSAGRRRPHVIGSQRRA